jgi:hypothetical protein
MTFFFSFAVLEPRALYRLGKHFAGEPHQPSMALLLNGTLVSRTLIYSVLFYNHHKLYFENPLSKIFGFRTFWGRKIFRYFYIQELFWG